MPKSLVLLALGALLLLPAASAQGLPAHSLSITISDLPATASINGTLMVLPFTVTATVNGMAPCVSPGNNGYDFTVVAEVVNATSNKTTAQVSPAAFRVAGPEAAPGSVTRTQQGQLVINPGPYDVSFVNATVRLTVSTAGGSPCQGVAATAAASASADTTATFLPPQGYGTTTPPGGREMPAMPAVLLMAALAALVAFVRRQ